MNEHWLDIAVREHRLLNLVGHQNFVRIPAESMIKLNTLKQKLLGTNRTLYEQQVFEEELANDNTII